MMGTPPSWSSSFFSSAINAVSCVCSAASWSLAVAMSAPAESRSAFSFSERVLELLEVVEAAVVEAGGRGDVLLGRGDVLDLVDVQHRADLAAALLVHDRARPWISVFSCVTFPVLSVSRFSVSASWACAWSRRVWVSTSCLLTVASLSAFRDIVIASWIAAGLVAGVVVVGVVGPAAQAPASDPVSAQAAGRGRRRRCGRRRGRRRIGGLRGRDAGVGEDDETRRGEEARGGDGDAMCDAGGRAGRHGLSEPGKRQSGAWHGKGDPADAGWRSYLLLTTCPGENLTRTPAAPAPLRPCPCQ